MCVNIVTVIGDSMSAMFSHWMWFTSRSEYNGLFTDACKYDAFYKRLIVTDWRGQISSNTLKTHVLSDLVDNIWHHHAFFLTISLDTGSRGVVPEYIYSFNMTNSLNAIGLVEFTLTSNCETTTIFALSLRKNSLPVICCWSTNPLIELSFCLYSRIMEGTVSVTKSRTRDTYPQRLTWLTSCSEGVQFCCYRCGLIFQKYKWLKFPNGEESQSLCFIWVKYNCIWIGSN